MRTRKEIAIQRYNELTARAETLQYPEKKWPVASDKSVGNEYFFAKDIEYICKIFKMDLDKFEEQTKTENYWAEHAEEKKKLVQQVQIEQQQRVAEIDKRCESIATKINTALGSNWQTVVNSHGFIAHFLDDMGERIFGSDFEGYDFEGYFDQQVDWDKLHKGEKRTYFYQLSLNYGCTGSWDPFKDSYKGQYLLCLANFVNNKTLLEEIKSDFIDMDIWSNASYERQSTLENKIKNPLK